MNRKEQLGRDLLDVRGRTLDLLKKVDDEFLRVRVHNFYSPIGWHFGHVGRTEEFWVCEATGQAPIDPALTFLYADRPDNPKDNRVNIPDRVGTIDYLRRTRDVALKALERTDLNSENPLIRDGYAWSFAYQHECQHQETIAEMLQLIQKQQSPTFVEPLEWKSSITNQLLAHPGGKFTMGDPDPCNYDNEMERHEVEVAPFSLAKYPVTAFEWSEFMQDGGYRRPELWSQCGWEWRVEVQAEMPEYWIRQSGGFATYGAFGVRAIHPDEPAGSLSHHEAQAYARWKGLRLPTEQEWEYAASAAGSGEKRRYAWGSEPPTGELANNALRASQVLPVDSTPNGDTPLGVSGLSGNLWEWTSTPFAPYPGFKAFPYEGYSKDHMKGAHYVCRGGSWATSATILRNTFRNWYVPTYRQGFLGLRLAHG